MQKNKKQSVLTSASEASAVKDTFTDLRMATGILNFIDSGFSTANNYRDNFQHWILFVTTEFFDTGNSYNLGYPEHFIQAHLEQAWQNIFSAKN